MTQPPAGGPGVPEGDPGGWRLPESAPERAAQSAPERAAQSGQWGQPAPPGWGTPAPSGPPGWQPAGYGKPPTGIVPLRPLSVGEILDGAFQAVRANPRTMVGTAAAVVAAVTVLSLVPEALLLNGLRDNPALIGASTSLEDQLDLIGGIGESRIVSIVLTFIAVTMLDALLIVPVSEAVLGRRMGAEAMWRRSRGRLLAALGLALLIGLVTVLAVVVVLVPGAVALAAGSGLVGGILLAAGVAGGIFVAVLLYTRWSLAAPALMLENASVTTSMRRSWRIVRGSTWRVFGILLLAGIIVNIGQAVVTVPVGLLAGLLTAGQSSPYESLPLTFAQLLVSGVGTIVAGAIFYPFSAAVSALLYIDLRMRREGLDVRLARAAAEGTPAGTA
jgi:hypothetical protein